MSKNNLEFNLHDVPFQCLETNDICSAPFKTQCAVSVTLKFDLSRSNCFGELAMTPYVSRTLTLTFINVVHEPIFKFGSQIAIFVNIDLGIAPTL